MTTKLYIDIETYSATNLKSSGVYRYSEDPDFQILMAAWALDDGPVRVAIGYDEVEKIPGLWDPEVLKVAHNANFERVCFSQARGGCGPCFCGGPSKEDPWDSCNNECGRRPGPYLPAEEWHDTAAVAAERGYPRHLGQLAKFLGGEQKDEAGTRLIRLFCVPNRKGERNTAETHPDEWAEFVEYCRQDVVTLRDVDERLGDFPTEAEREVYLADQRINDLGLKLDVPLCAAAVEAMEDSVWRNELEISRLTKGVVRNPGSPAQLQSWLRGTGLRVPDMRAETIEKLLEGPLEDVQRQVLELRQELALASVKKFAAALEQVSSDGRLRGRFQFFGAHTGRWAGRGAQPQNLPREALADDAVTTDAIMALLDGDPTDSSTLKALVRAMFLGPLIVVDYAAIEARVIAWLAGEEWALEAFRKKRDIYVETAERMSTKGNKLTRAQGKVAVLALGYNGGVNSLRAMGAEGSDDSLKRLVYQWRDANPTIVNLWRELGQKFRSGGEVGEILRVERDGTSRHLVLPSGRAISYHRCQFKMVDGAYGPRLEISFADPGKPGLRVRTYGGRLSENATQAVARDVMAEALVRLVNNGYDVVGHIHDEILVEGTGSVEEVSKIMTEVPAWADGLPIDGEGFTAARYKKG